MTTMAMTTTTLYLQEYVTNINFIHIYNKFAVYRYVYVLHYNACTQVFVHTSGEYSRILLRPKIICLTRTYTHSVQYKNYIIILLLYRNS